jgi:hypothetical protein
MPNKVLTRAEMQSAVDALARAGGEAGPAAAAERIPESTLRNRLKRAAELGLKPSSGTEDMSNPAHLRMMLKRAEKALADNQREALSEEQIKRAILQMKQAVDELKPPTWLVQARPGNKSPGVPLLFLSDLHWGEKVEPSQINGVNRYSVKIAHKRMQTLAEGAGRLLSIISPELDYPASSSPWAGT